MTSLQTTGTSYGTAEDGIDEGGKHNYFQAKLLKIIGENMRVYNCELHFEVIF